MSGEKNKEISSLWSAFLQGDDKAFSGIYFLLIGQLLSYGQKLTPDKGILFDAALEVFEELYEKRIKCQIPVENPRSYLFVALRNNILKKKLQTRKFTPQEFDEKQLGEFMVEYSFQEELINREISEEKHRRLKKAIETLSSGQKEIIYLKFDNGFGYKEISEMMGITIESARKQLYRSLLSLRNILDSETFFNLFIFLKK